MPTIEQLNQRHPSVDVQETRILRALYNGGKDFRAELGTLLPKRPHEPPTFYNTRASEAVYRNYVGPIVDHFASLLFSSRPVAVPSREGEQVADADEFYSRFRDDATGSGADMDAVLKQQLTDAMVTKCGWVRVHHPDSEGLEPETQAEYEARGLGDCWLSCLSHDDVLDWDADDNGALEWVLTYSCESKRGSVGGGRDRVTETWSHLLPDRVDVYSISYLKDEKPAKETEVPLVSSTPHRFGAVPVVCLDLPVGLWVTHRLESPQVAHFRLSNAQQWLMFSTCYAQPVYKLKDSDEVPKMGAGWGIIIGAEEEVEWIAPPSSPYDALGSAIGEHKDEIFRIAQNMALGVENNAAAVGRSAESKQADAQATRVVLLAYSRIVKEAIERIYDLVSRVRGDGYEWSIEGLDDFAAADLGGLVEVLATVEAAGGIPSKTFQVNMKSRLAESLLPDMDQATKQTIRKEIESGVADQSDDAKAEREMGRLKAMSGALDNESKQSRKPPQDQE